MRRPRVRLTLRFLLAIVAVSALLLTVGMRPHPVMVTDYGAISLVQPGVIGPVV